MDQVDIAHAAEFLLHLRRQRRSVQALPPEIRPNSLSDAYAIQDELHSQAGWPLEVYKVGCTSEAARRALGVSDAIGGRIPTEGCFESGASVPRSFFGAEPLLECELAMRVTASGAVDAVAPALELVNSRFADTMRAGGPSLVADNSAAAGVVLGAPVAITGAGDLTSLEVTVRDGSGTALATGSGAAILDGPEGSVRWTLAHEAGRGRTVDAGRWIITGTCTGLTPTTFGASYTADFGALGTVTVTLAG